MKNLTGKKNLFILSFITAVLAVLLIATTSCEDMGFPSTTPQETPAPEPASTTGTVINSKDTAILAVYQRLLGEAEGYDAKMYLSDFYTTCDNWTAQSDYFKDGSGTWHVVVDMTAQEDWTYRPYWQQASWLVFEDGKVIPSNLFQANALRIEADLQALSSEPAAE